MKPQALQRRWRVQQDEQGWAVLRSLLPDEQLSASALVLSITAAGLPETSFEQLAHVETRPMLSATITASGGKLVDVGYHEAVQLLAKMFQDALAAEPDVDAEAGLLAEHWQSDKGICFSEKTGDGRDFTNCDWSWRDPSVSLLPLMLQTENDYGHFGAELAGYFESIAQANKTAIAAAGRFYDSEIGEQFRDMLLGARRFGVSVDPGAVTADMECVAIDEDGWCEEMAIIFEAYEIIGATGTGFPAFAEASIMLDPATLQPSEDEEMMAASAVSDVDETPINADTLDAATSLVEQLARDDETVELSTISTCVDQLRALREGQLAAADTEEEVAELVVQIDDLIDQLMAALDIADVDDNDNEGEAAAQRARDAELAVVDAELTVLSQLSDETIVDMQAHGLALHSKCSVTHMHRHSAAGQQGSDSTHEHTHMHDNDASHTGSAHKSGSGHANRKKPISASAATLFPSRPPRAWLDLIEPEYGQENWLDGQAASEFLVEQEDGALAVPLTILDSGQMFGNLARWGQCHVGYAGQCVSPPEEATYEHFNVGEVVCEDGSRVACGVLSAGCDHAATHLRAPRAHDHYAHNGVSWARVHVTAGLYGPWAAGCLMPDVTEEQLALYRASAPSGDWRRIGNGLRLISVLAVNTPGFPIAREALAASGLSMIASVSAPQMYVEDSVPQSLVAAGIVTRCPECAKRKAQAAQSSGFGDDDRAMLRHLDATTTTLEKRTRHLALAERARLLDEIGVSRADDQP